MKKPIAFTLLSPISGISVGWGNGYVAIPKGHPLYEMDYDSIHRKTDIEIHGGLTFSENSIIGQPEETKGMWIIGFDCAHLGDTPETCPQEFVEAEAQRLLEQVLAVTKESMDRAEAKEAMGHYEQLSEQQKELFKQMLFN